MSDLTPGQVLEAVEQWNLSYCTVADYSSVQGLKDAVQRLHGRKV